MKTIIQSTMRVGPSGSNLLFTLLIICLFPFLATAGQILNVNSIKISKDYPASFVLDLEEGDIVTVKYAKISGKSDINQLLVQVIDLNQQDEEVVTSFNRSGRDFLAEYDGKYRVDFLYNGPSGLLRNRNLTISINMDLEGYDGLQEGEAAEILHAASAVIEETEEKAFQLRYYFTKGDQINVSSQDVKANLLKLKVVQLAKSFSVSSFPTINIPSDGTYTLKFYLEGDDNESLLSLRRLLENDEVLFKDLIIFRERAVDFAAMAAANTGLSSTEQDQNSDQDSDLFDGQEEESDPYSDLLANLNDQNRSREESDAALFAYLEKTQEMYEEMMNKKNIRTEIYATPYDEQLYLEPEFNFASDGKNRDCIELRLPPPQGFNIWFFWVGVGENAQEAYDQHNEIITQTFKKSFADAQAEYLYNKFSGSGQPKRNPQYPTESRYSEYLNEDVEYAIVDYWNRERFLAGKKYSSLHRSDRNAKYISADFGFSGRTGQEEAIYFCGCNNNKATPVSVFFKYFIIDVEEIEY